MKAGSIRANARLPVLAAAILLLLAGCVSAPGAVTPNSSPNFYNEAETSARRPGDVLSSEPMDGAPIGASAFRILYRSTGLDGKSIPVSGTVIIPAGPPPPGGRQIVAWAHGTTGVARSCAPSLFARPFAMIMGLSDLLAAGYAVAATDYPGLGTAGPHPYLVGVSEARAVLDSVRAVRHLVANSSARFAVWGHSQGGQAALFAGRIARSYAPELALVGVATAAPPTFLSELLRDDVSEPVGKLIVSFTLWSWSRVYGANLDQIVFPSAEPVIDSIAAGCSETMGEDLRLLLGTWRFHRRLLSADINVAEPWAGLIATNTSATSSAGVPLFIAQGTDDRIFRQSVTDAFVEGLCSSGAVVHYVVLPGAKHVPSGRISAPMATQWIHDRFAGLAAPNDCRAR